MKLTHLLLTLFLCLGLVNSSVARLYLVSQNQEGNFTTKHSPSSHISSNGRYVVFSSHDNNIVDYDTNQASDIFVFDLLTLEYEMVSISSDGVVAIGSSEFPSISDDGRYVAFMSIASNLVLEDNNGVHDVFVHDRETKQTIRISVDSEGIEGNHQSVVPKISGDGNSVLFYSRSSNLTALGDAKPDQLYMHNIANGETNLVSKDGNSNPINNGVFTQYFFGTLYYDQLAHTYDISEDGTNIVFIPNSHIFPNQQGLSQAVKRSLINDMNTLISHAYNDPNQSGNYVVSRWGLSISSDGSHVGFSSNSQNLTEDIINGDPTNHVFFDNGLLDETILVDKNQNDLVANSAANYNNLSKNTRYIAYSSRATDLNSIPQNNNGDGINIYLKDLESEQSIDTQIVSINNQNIQPNNGSSVRSPSVANNGFVSFTATDFIFDGNSPPENISQIHVNAPCKDPIKAPVTWRSNNIAVELPPNVEITSEIVINDRNGCVGSLGIHPEFSNANMNYFLGLKIDLEAPDGTIIPIKGVEQGDYPNGSWTLFDLDLRIEGTWTIKITNTSDRFVRTSLDQWRLLFNFPILQAISLP